MNAFEDGDSIVCDTIRYSRNMLFPDPDGSWGFDPTPPRLCRWRIDPSRSTVSEEFFDDGTIGEMPSIDPRFCGRSYRHGFSAGFNNLGANFDTIFHYDWERSRVKSYRPGPGRFPHEPVFAPRSQSTEEADGYLLSVVYDANRNCSDVIVLEATNIPAGPIATVRLPHRTGPGLHGTWRTVVN